MRKTKIGKPLGRIEVTQTVSCHICGKEAEEDPCLRCEELQYDAWIEQAENEETIQPVIE